MIGRGRYRPVRSRRAFLGWAIALGTGLVACSREGAGSWPAGVAIWSGPGRDPGRLVTPRGVCVSGDRVWVVDRSGRVQAFDLQGRVVAEVRVTEGTRGFPIGVLSDGDGGFLLVDTHGHRLRRFDRSGAELLAGGDEGTSLGSFAFPQRAVRDRDGVLFVTEYGTGDSNRVQVFDRDLVPLRMFGSSGREPGRFTRAMGIGLLRDEVFVTDAADRILVFGKDGAFRRQFGTTGTAAGELRYPYGLAVVDDTLVVAEYGNHRVQRFRSDGSSLGCFGGPGQEILLGPWDVATDGAGTLFVCDTGHHRIVVGRVDGIPWTRS